MSKHFVITRFDYPADYKLLNKRIELFNRFTRPSIEAQTCKDFEWIILGSKFDAPATFLTLDTYQNYILGKSEGLILMSRVDNDDILLPDFVADAQKELTKPGLLEFKGYRLDLRTNEFYKDKLHNSELTSPFLTLAQTKKNFHSVYFKNHSKMWRYFDLKIVEKRNWVQIIHDCNWVLNKQSIDQVRSRGECIQTIESVQALLKP